MKRYEYALREWCEKAASLIEYKPDRKKVISELYSHAIERFDSLTARGMTDDEALQSTLNAMGDAYKVAIQLAAVHRPFWGYFLRTCQILLIILLCLSVIPVWNYVSGLNLKEAPNFRDFDVYDTASYGGDTGRTLLHISQQNASFSTDGSTFTLTDAAVFTELRSDGTVSQPILQVQIRQHSLLPAQELGEYQGFYTYVIPMTARDSLGNEYDFIHSGSRATTSVQSGIFTRTHAYWINDFPTDAQWVDICYERDGRSYCLRVYLTGGDGT